MLALAAAGPRPAAATAIGDPVHGEVLFQRQCSACHQIGPEAIHRVGPRLTGLFGRKAGSAEGFKYSKSMLRMGTVDEIANAILFLASDEASFATGVILPIDGGISV